MTAFGVVLPQFGPLASAAVMRDAALAAEGLGFDSVWVSDHVVIPESIDTEYPFGTFPVEQRQNYFEPIACVNWLAGITSRVQIGTSVLVLPIRNPVVTAKQLAVADALSGGRLVVGVGAGWLREEFSALGLDETGFAARGRITDEWLAIFRSLWADTTSSSYDGEHFSLPPVRSFPKPVGRMPVWVGGNAPASRRRAAKHDGWHALRIDPATFEAGLGDIRRLLEENGRSPDALTLSLRCTVGSGAGSASAAPDNMVGDATRLREQVAAFAKLGCEHLVFDLDHDGTASSYMRELEWAAAATL